MTNLLNINRRVIYLFVLIALATPLIYNISFQPARLQTSEKFYQVISELKPNDKQIVLISSDWGPNTKAENQAQLEAAIEHLMRKRIPFAITSIYALASPFIDSIPKEVAEKIKAEGEYEPKYGTAWVNLGYRIGGRLMVEGIAKSEDLHEFWKADAYGTPTKDLNALKNVKTIKNIGLLLEFTGLVGAFDSWVQFFTSEDYTPTLLHGCTSITIPEARTYVSSGQLAGMHEGLAGAAYYEYLLSKEYPKRIPGDGLKMNTSLAFAQLVILFFILLGNINIFLTKKNT